MDIRIDDQFKALIPPLSEGEYQLLESSIITDGCRDALVVWEEENILIDGHNRFEICQRNGIDFAVVYQSFDFREAALTWIIENQLGRRNISEAARISMALELKPIEEELAKKRQLSTLKQGESPVVPNLAQRENTGRTRDKLAELAGVSHGTFEAGANVLQNGSDAIAKKYKSGKIAASRANKLIKALEGVSDKIEFIVDRYDIDSPDTVDLLKRLEKSSKGKDSNNTIDEILGSGYIQMGEEEEAIHISESPKKIEEALLRKSYIHKEVSGQAKAFVTHNTGETEWYTPKYIIDAVIKVMGDIDLDPATSEAANEIVNATNYYTVEEDGLDNEWFGRVFLNPPYSNGLIDKFIDKLCNDIDNVQDFQSAVVLVNNATETKWFQHLMEYASAICLHKGRIKFENTGNDNKDNGGPLQGQILVFIGPEDMRDEFMEVFSQYGVTIRVR